MTKTKLVITQELIDSLLPDAPDGYLGYEVVEQSHMWFAVYLLHPPYSYKEGVRTIWVTLSVALVWCTHRFMVNQTEPPSVVCLTCSSKTLIL